MGTHLYFEEKGGDESGASVYAQDGVQCKYFGLSTKKIIFRWGRPHLAGRRGVCPLQRGPCGYNIDLLCSKTCCGLHCILTVHPPQAPWRIPNNTPSSTRGCTVKYLTTVPKTDLHSRGKIGRPVVLVPITEGGKLGAQE